MSDKANFSEATQQVERRRRALELASIILLASASLVTSWSSYQASLWSGIQATNYNQANALRVESTRESTIGGFFRGLDVAMFMAWVSARASGNEQLEQFSKALFEAGYRANHYADTYVLGTVVFATVLFFCGIVQQFRDIRIRVFLLSVAILLLMFGLSKILVLPSA